MIGLKSYGVGLVSESVPAGSFCSALAAGLPVLPRCPGVLAVFENAEERQARSGVTVIVENRAEASGTLGVRAVTGARLDGHTLLCPTQSPLVANPPLARNLPDDPIRDLAAIGAFLRNGYVPLVPSNFLVRTMAEVVAVLRAAPPRHHGCLATDLLRLPLGTKIEPVPYWAAHRH